MRVAVTAEEPRGCCSRSALLTVGGLASVHSVLGAMHSLEKSPTMSVGRSSPEFPDSSCTEFLEAVRAGDLARVQVRLLVGVGFRGSSQAP